MTCVRSTLISFLILLIAGVAHAGRGPDTIIFSPKALVKAKQRVHARDARVMPAFEKLIAQADRAMRAPAEAVVLKPGPPPGGDKHDYWSLSPDWWPNPNSASGKPYTWRDGQLNPEAMSEKYDRNRMKRMSTDALTLALAYYLTGSEEYAGKGTALIWSWCCDSVTKTRPTLEFAHSRPGETSGHYSGIIETRDLIKVAEAARLLEPSQAWSKVVSKKTIKWFTQYAKWLQKNQFGHLESRAPNHHSIWYAAQLAVFAHFTGQTHLARSLIGAATPRLIGFQVAPNGTMPAELKRSRSRYYSFFTLEALFILAAVGERVNVDIWNWKDDSGTSLKTAMDMLAPYISSDTPWPHGKTGEFDPFLFTPLFHRAALVYKDTSYLDYLTALPPGKLLTDRAQLFY